MRARAALTLAALALGGCAGGQGGGPAPARGPGGGAVAEETPGRADGEDILQTRCTECHDLGGLPAFADYWGAEEWRSMVDTMIGYGARVTPEELPVLVEYLAENY